MAITAPNDGDFATDVWPKAVTAALSPYGCVLLRTADQTISDATDTAITFPSGSVTEVLDTNGFHDTGSNTARITIPTGGDGWYDLGFNVGFALNSTNQRLVWIELNGSAGSGTMIFSRSMAAHATSTSRLGGSVPYLLAAGDYVTLNVRQNSGGSLAVLGAGLTYTARFWCLRRWPT